MGQVEEVEDGEEDVSALEEGRDMVPFRSYRDLIHAAIGRREKLPPDLKQKLLQGTDAVLGIEGRVTPTHLSQGQVAEIVAFIDGKLIGLRQSAPEKKAEILSLAILSNEFRLAALKLGIAEYSMERHILTVFTEQGLEMATIMGRLTEHLRTNNEVIRDGKRFDKIETILKGDAEPTDEKRQDALLKLSRTQALSTPELDAKARTKEPKPEPAGSTPKDKGVYRGVMSTTRDPREERARAAGAATAALNLVRTAGQDRPASAPRPAERPVSTAVTPPARPATIVAAVAPAITAPAPAAAVIAATKETPPAPPEAPVKTAPPVAARPVSAVAPPPAAEKQVATPDEAQIALAAKDRQIASLQARLVELEAAALQHASSMDNLKGQVSALEQQLLEVRRDLGAAVTRQRALEEERASNEERHARDRARITELETSTLTQAMLDEALAAQKAGLTASHTAALDAKEQEFIAEIDAQTQQLHRQAAKREKELVDAHAVETRALKDHIEALEAQMREEKPAAPTPAANAPATSHAKGANGHAARVRSGASEDIGAAITDIMNAWSSFNTAGKRHGYANASPLFHQRKSESLPWTHHSVSREIFERQFCACKAQSADMLEFADVRRALEGVEQAYIAYFQAKERSAGASASRSS